MIFGNKTSPIFSVVSKPEALRLITEMAKHLPKSPSPSSTSTTETRHDLGITEWRSIRSTQMQWPKYCFLKNKLDIKLRQQKLVIIILVFTTSSRKTIESLYDIQETQDAPKGTFNVPSNKQTNIASWKITIFNRRYVFQMVVVSICKFLPNLPSGRTSVLAFFGLQWCQGEPRLF